MKEYVIQKEEAGQSLNKFLHRYMPKAPSSFFYKMFRKKNIVLNGRKVDGREVLAVGDTIKFFLAEETLLHFQDRPAVKGNEYEKAFRLLRDIQVIYEDDDVLILNKPAGVLTQKARPDDVSLNEWLLGYLLETKKITVKQLATFRPSVLNRLDRNTYGLVICSKSLEGAQVVSEWIRERRIRKFYQLIVKGTGLTKTTIKGYLQKDTDRNRVTLYESREDSLSLEDTEKIETRYEPVRECQNMTWLEVELITGKTHQIRAHMASIGHPILGDYKYGDRLWNEKYRSYGVESQLLTACRIEFPQTESSLEQLNHRIVEIPVPEIYHTIFDQ